MHRGSAARCHSQPDERMSYWGYNEGSNELPLTRDPLRAEPTAPPLWQRALLVVVFLTVVLGIALIAKLT